MNSLPSVVIAIIVSNILLSLLGFKNQAFFKKYQFQMAKIKSGEQIKPTNEPLASIIWGIIVWVENTSKV